MITNKASREFTKREIYKMTQDQTTSIKDAAGITIYPAGWIDYTDTNARGYEVDVLAILDKDGTVYSTISETFKNAFYKIVEVMGEEEFGIDVILGTSKNGRNYVTCSLN